MANTGITNPNTATWQVLANKGDTGATGATGATGITISDTPPLNPTLNQLWIDTSV